MREEMKKRKKELESADPEITWMGSVKQTPEPAVPAAPPSEPPVMATPVKHSELHVEPVKVKKEPAAAVKARPSLSEFKK